MKTADHVEQLLRQGRSPKELVSLGFPKRVVTRVRRRLREEKKAQKTKVQDGGTDADNNSQPEVVSATGTGPSEVAALLAAAQELGIRKHDACPYIQDNYCVVRAWDDRAQVPQGIGQAALVDEEKPRWFISPSPFYCALCTTFLEDRVTEMETEVSGDPLSGARNQIKCPSCGNKGFIAASIQCTKCKHVTWWGWQPKQ